MGVIFVMVWIFLTLNCLYTSNFSLMMQVLPKPFWSSISFQLPTWK